MGPSISYFYANQLWRFSATSGVPILETAVDYLMRSRYSRPFACELTLLAPVPEQMKGEVLSLKRLSPEEDHFAILLATARDLKKNVFVDEPCLSMCLIVM